MMGCYDEEVKLEENDSFIHNQKNDELVHEVILKNSRLYQIIGKKKLWLIAFIKSCTIIMFIGLLLEV